ncbi:MAG: PIN domain-containing protein [Fibrobacterota bacterium]
MILADTSVWIEYFRKHEPVFSLLARLLAGSRILGSEAVFAELLQGARNESERRLILEHWNYLPKWDESGLYIRAGAEAGRHKWSSAGIGLIDSAIIILAHETQSQVWTLDKKLLAVLKPYERYQADG